MSKISKKMKKHRAITLIELLIYLAITMIVLVVIIDLVTRIAQNKTSTLGQEEVISTARFLGERLTYAVKQASSIDGSYPADDINLTYNASTVTFSMVGGQIFYQEGMGPPVALTNAKVEIAAPGGSNIFTKFENADAQSVEIKFNVRFKQNNLSRDFETAVLARGK